MVLRKQGSKAIEKLMRKPSSILIVEDEKHLNEAYQMILRKAGYTVQVAFNGQEALEVSQAHPPDLIFLDLHMPRMNGIEFLKKYRSAWSQHKAKIVIFSNYDRQDEIDEAYKLGASRYVLKAGASAKELLLIARSTLTSQELYIHY